MPLGSSPKRKRPLVGGEKRQPKAEGPSLQEGSTKVASKAKKNPKQQHVKKEINSKTEGQSWETDEKMKQIVTGNQKPQAKTNVKQQGVAKKKLPVTDESRRAKRRKNESTRNEVSSSSSSGSDSDTPLSSFLTKAKQNRQIRVTDLVPTCQVPPRRANDTLKVIDHVQPRYVC